MSTALRTCLDCPAVIVNMFCRCRGAPTVKVTDSDGYLPALGTLIHKALELLTNGYEPERAFRSALRINKVQGSAARTCDVYMYSILMDLFIKSCRMLNVRLVNFELPLLPEYGSAAAFSGYIDCTVFNSDGTLRDR